MKRPRSRLQQEIQQQAPFASREEEAFLNLERTANLLSQAFAGRMRPYGLTPTQYNVLRILRGAHPEPLSCREIGSRMVTPMPDVTRLVDRLAQRGLVRRRRDASGDRRVVLVSVEESALELLERLDQPVVDWLRELLGHLGEKELERLIEGLEKAREGAGCGVEE